MGKLTCQPKCEKCGDTGWRPSGHWRPLLNDAHSCECGALAKVRAAENRLEKPTARAALSDKGRG